MTHVLVLQWPASDLSDYDALIDIEEMLEASVSAPASIDGHDMGTGEMNIFVLTDDPDKTFREAQLAIGQHARWESVRVASRLVDGERFTVIWPPGLATFRVS